MYILDPQRWKIKPRMWGSHSMVQQVIMDNCEKIYGINHEDLAIIFPMWERSGEKVFDYSKYKTDGNFSGDVSWDQDRIDFGASVDRITSSTTNMNTSNGTVLFGFISNVDYDDGIQHYFFDTNAQRFAILKHLTNQILYITDGTSRGLYTFAYQQDIHYHIGCTWPSNEFYVDGLLDNDFTDGDLGSLGSNLYLGDINTGAASKSLNGKLDYFYALNVVLTESQFALFADRPYGLFEPISKPVYFFYTAAPPVGVAPTAVIYGPLFGPLGGPI